MNSNTRPQQTLLARRRGDRHSKLIVGASLPTDASGAGEPVQPFEIDLERISNLFPSECDEPTDPLVASGFQPVIAHAGQRVADEVPAEDSIFMIVPAGPGVLDPDSLTRHQSQASTSSSRISHRALAGSLASSTVHALRSVGRFTLSIAWTIAQHVSRMTIQSALIVARAAARYARQAATRAKAAVASLRTYTPHLQHRAGRLVNNTKRAFTERCGSLLSRLQATSPPLGGRELAVFEGSVIAAVVAILVGIAAVGIGRFEPQSGSRLTASRLVDRTTTFASLRAPVQPLAAVGEPRTSLKTPIAPSRETLTNPAPARAPAAATAAIQRVLNRYRDAFSTLDDRAVQSVWPSVDVRGLRTDFGRIYEQNLDYESCDITVTGADAGAVCRGVVESMPSSTRVTRRESRRWRFVLRKVNDRWFIDTVDVNSVGGEGGPAAGRGAGQTNPNPSMLLP